MSEKPSFPRKLRMNLPQGQTAFLWGARKTGKSTYLRNHFPDASYYDLLKTDICMRYTGQPHLFREEVLALPEAQLAQPIIIDEVQKVPALLDEIHWLIENTAAYFILCGSSARKLKRGAANLLGGRAWRYAFYPLTYPEIPDFDLLHALNTGLIPSHYLASDIKRSLSAYVMDYLKEEIQAEGLTRNLPAFARFLDSLSYTLGELINYTNIARDCGINGKTVKEYYQILVDTLLGYFIYPFNAKSGRQAISQTPKFYLFDVGVAGALARRQITTLKGSEAGRAFEQWVLQELVAYRGLNDEDFPIEFWRTKTGLETDFILDRGRIAIEVKISQKVSKTDLKGLIAFMKDHQPEQAYVVSQDPTPRKVVLDDGQHISILPWRHFCETLWAGEIL